MLRVRPTVHTPHPEAWALLLGEMGLGEITPPPATGAPSGTAQRCFAADSGRILLQESAKPGTELVFEVRDLEKFAQWTIADGTPVDLRTAADGSTALAHITAPDGLEFTALGVDAAVDAGTPRFPQDTETPRPGTLAVLALWNTPDVPGASSTLANIGAKPDTTSNGGAWAQYRAKHGGFVAAHAGASRGIELSLEYSGKLEALADRLSSAGIEAQLVDEAYGRTLLVEHPDGAQLWINERQQDLYGYSRH
ncbi:hypothetical protein GCM10009715_12380 [Paeniglutamicibacter psychrophenolicus]|uniref:VOC family protein n=1 Tax=Paeniglutamicibacter psychrophenolicus TaxID=257454 RepID=A0ABS4W7L3_9MICC|nr:hypothetical protein [Paeniglutamicibacter psychrophenolicus]MBP2372187.1 hypothetical protein [Paeniglutamicibacter psychrophenolicus]